MSGQVDKHRAFLQTQFNRMTWGIGIILLIGAGTFGWLFGKSYESTQAKIIQEVEQKIIEYRIVDSFKRRLDEQIILAATKPDVIETIGEQVSGVVSEQVEANTDKIITARLSEEIKRISDQDLKQLVDRAVKDSLTVLKEIQTQLNMLSDKQRIMSQFISDYTRQIKSGWILRLPVNPNNIEELPAQFRGIELEATKRFGTGEEKE